MDRFDDLQTQLLTRTTRQVRLTSIGERSLERARGILDEWEEAEASVSADTQAVSAELSIAMP